LAASADQNPTVVNFIRTGPRDGTPVVLIHAAGLDLTYWDAQIGALSEEHDVVAFDLPGHGLTPGTADDWTVGRLTDIVAQVTTAIGAERYHLAGISLGGLIAQACALARPAQVASLTLINTAAAFTDGARAAMRARGATVRAQGMSSVMEPMIGPWFTAATVSRRPDLLDRVRKTLLADDPQVHGAMWDFIAGFDVLRELPSLNCPTLVMVGDQDETTPVATAAGLRDAVKGARLRVVANAAHVAPIDQPEVVNRHLLSFLAAIA
jgi:3-oxoadipate enol-lactonase